MLNDIINDAGIFGNVFALVNAVAAGDCLSKFPVDVTQSQRQAVDFFFNDEFNFTELFNRVANEIFNFVTAEHVLK